MKIRIVKYDVFGGFTAAMVAVPLALAFGARPGRDGAIFFDFNAAVFGSACGSTPRRICVSDHMPTVWR